MDQTLLVKTVAVLVAIGFGLYARRLLRRYEREGCQDRDDRTGAWFFTSIAVLLVLATLRG